MSLPERLVFDTVEALNDAVRQSLLELAARCVQQHGVFRMALSGGSTPKRLYQSLVGSDFPWSRCKLYWGDERNVPHEHPDSNFKMVSQAMLEPAHVPGSSFCPVPVNPEAPDQAAAAYEQALRAEFANQAFPKWDLVLLGMGDDGHTASLFPETAALAESRRWFVENWVEKFNAYRYTLTAPAINSGAQIWFLITGENKRQPLQEVLYGKPNPQRYPSQLVKATRLYATSDALPASS